MSLLSANLRAFTAVAHKGTVHGAAAELRLTQTGVTQRIRALEKELSATLFLRSRKGMKLTAEGEALLRYCQGAKDLEGQAMSQITGGGVERPIHIHLTGPTSVMTSRIISQCAPLYARFPHLYLNHHISDSADRIDFVRTGRATLAIVSPNVVPNEMDSKMLKPDRYLLVASSKWKGRRIEEILRNEKIIDFDEQDSTSINYLKKFGLAAKALKSRLFVNNNRGLIQLIREGVGFGTLTQEVARKQLASGELIALNGGAAMEDPLALAWYPRKEMPAYLKAITQAIK